MKQNKPKKRSPVYDPKHGIAVQGVTCLSKTGARSHDSYEEVDMYHALMGIGYEQILCN